VIFLRPAIRCRMRTPVPITIFTIRFTMPRIPPCRAPARHRPLYRPPPLPTSNTAILSRKCSNDFLNCASETQIIASCWLNRVTGLRPAISFRRTAPTTLRETLQTQPEREIALWAKASRLSHRKARGQMGSDTASE
jgi:hypothetical protein